MAKRITREEAERIKSLRKVTVTVGGNPQTGYLDKENGLFYAVDADGEPNGLFARIDKSKSPAPKLPEDTELETGEDYASETEAEEKKGFAALLQDKKKLALCIGIILVTVAVLGFIIVAMLKSSTQQPVQDPTPSAMTTPLIDVTTTAEPEESADPTKRQVIRIKQDVLQGHQITPDDVEETTIPVETYEQFAMFGKDLYLWDRLDYIVGTYASKFLQTGHYMEFSDVSAQQPFGVDPWLLETEDNLTTVRIPLDQETAHHLMVTYGSYFDLTVRRTSSNQVVVGQPTAGPGEQDVHQTTSVDETYHTDEYVVSGLTICDILNADGYSIYNTIAAYCGIPVGERYLYLSDALEKESDLYQRLTPAYIVTKATNDQVKAIGDLTKSGTSCVIRFNGDFDMTTDAKKAFALDASNVRNTIEQAQTDLIKKAENEEAERQRKAEEALQKQQQEQANQGG